MELIILTGEAWCRIHPLLINKCSCLASRHISIRLYPGVSTAPLCADGRPLGGDTGRDNMVRFIVVSGCYPQCKLSLMSYSPFLLFVITCAFI